MNSNRIKSKKIQIGDYYLLPLEPSKLTEHQEKVQKLLEETQSRADDMINTAETKSQVIIQAANTEAENIIAQARKKAQEEYESVKQKAHQEGLEEGRQDGLDKFEEECKEALKSLETLSKATFEMKKNIIDSATRDIVELISVITDKVCHQSFSERMLYNITIEAIKLLNDKERVTIIVNPKLVAHITKLLPYMQQEIPKMESIKISEDKSLSEDGVIVETLESRLDSRLSVQIAEITRQMLTGGDS